LHCMHTERVDLHRAPISGFYTNVTLLHLWRPATSLHPFHISPMKYGFGT
jgi:hypothetical protein